MDEKRTYYKDYNHLLTNLQKGLEEYEAGQIRDILFFLTEFRKEKKFPEDMQIYITTLPLEGLEVTSAEKVSNILVTGVAKYKQLQPKAQKVPPLVVVRGRVRSVIVYGETSAIEAYLRKFKTKAIVFDVEDGDPFEIFKLNDQTPVFLIPLIQEYIPPKGESPNTQSPTSKQLPT